MLAIAPGWELHVQRGPDWLVVKVEVPGSAHDETPPLADVLWDQLQRHSIYRVALELDKVEVLSSYMIGQLIQLYKHICEHNGVMRLCGLSPYNCQVLRACHLDDRFLPYHDVHEAVRGCYLPPQPR